MIPTLSVIQERMLPGTAEERHRHSWHLKGRPAGDLMKLNHINLGVTDVPQAVDLFQRYFGLVPAGDDMPINEHMAFLRDDVGALLSMFRVKDPQYPKVFHIGFLQDTPEQVRAIHRQLTEGGFEIPAPSENHGRLTFYFNTPVGVVIEVESLLG